MNEELKQQWVEALRSGEYQQTTGCLRDIGGFCCLGVLCDILDRSCWDVHTDDSYGVTDYSYGDGDEDALIPADISERIGLPRRVQEDLAELNDHGFSFAEIALHIELEL